MAVILRRVLPQMMACRGSSLLRPDISSMRPPSRPGPRRWWLLVLQSMAREWA